LSPVDNVPELSTTCGQLLAIMAATRHTAALSVASATPAVIARLLRRLLRGH